MGFWLTFDHGHDGALLDGRRPLEAVGVDSTQELALEVHGIEAVGGLVIVGLDLTCVDVLQTLGISHDCGVQSRLTGAML